ncbi:FRG domain-containing protein, partial [Halobacillus sp. BBL2006]|uniref:FRG domain-containing protein n=1 Tax=Halobacillus sp. BBL2006 TaxID=1543706 RepID=UPI0005430F54
EWMSTAQHFGLPTRLLDWSQSPLSALFFAVENTSFEYEEGSNDCAVVWCLNPNALNERSRFIEDFNILPNIIEQNETLHNKLKEKYGVGVILPDEIPPIAIICPSNNSRIYAQRGVFTLFPLRSLPLEEQSFAGDILVKIKINKNLKQELKRQLFDIGISYSSIYPELEFISKDIKSEYLMN